MRHLVNRPGGRWMVGIGAALALVVVAGIVTFAIWVYGGNAAPQTRSSATATAPSTVKLAPGQTDFAIDQSTSSASFTIGEVLFGSPNTVVGKTNQVTGDILIDTNDPSKSQMGPVRVDLSGLATDNDMRTNTLQGRILETGDPANQYATFTATSFKGLPATFTVGALDYFQVTGNLTVHQVTKVETFAVEFTANSPTQVTGSATTTVRYEDFNLSVPNVQSVSSVSDTVVLTLNFTAKAK